MYKETCTNVLLYQKTKKITQQRILKGRKNILPFYVEKLDYVFTKVTAVKSTVTGRGCFIWTVVYWKEKVRSCGLFSDFFLCYLFIIGLFFSKFSYAKKHFFIMIYEFVHSNKVQTCQFNNLRFFCMKQVLLYSAFQFISWIILK